MNRIMMNTMMTYDVVDNEYIYFMSNASFDEDVIKIGWSRKHPSLRACELYTSGLPTPFTIEYVITTNKGNGSKLEKEIHNYLNEYRMNDKREFFKINKQHLFNIITNDLKLKTTNDLLNIPTNNNKNNIINEIVKLYDKYNKNASEFLNKLKQNKTELKIEENNGKIVKVYVNHLIPTDINYETAGNSLNTYNIFDDWVCAIVTRCEFIEKDLLEHTKMLEYLLCNTEEIRKNLGGKMFRRDNIWFKNEILKSQQKLDKLLNDYIWEF